MLGVLVFLPRKFLDFWHFLPRFWQLFLAKYTRFCKIFQDRGKESNNILGLPGNKTKNSQDLGKRNKKVVHQINTSSKDILLLLEASKYSSTFYFVTIYSDISIKFVQVVYYLIRIKYRFHKVPSNVYVDQPIKRKAQFGYEISWAVNWI